MATKIDMSKIDWVGRKEQLQSGVIVTTEDDDIHTRPLRGNVFFIDMKLPREERFSHIRPKRK